MMDTYTPILIYFASAINLVIATYIYRKADKLNIKTNERIEEVVDRVVDDVMDKYKKPEQPEHLTIPDAIKDFIQTISGGQDVEIIELKFPRNNQIDKLDYDDIFTLSNNEFEKYIPTVSEKKLHYIRKHALSGEHYEKLALLKKYVDNKK